MFTQDVIDTWLAYKREKVQILAYLPLISASRPREEDVGPAGILLHSELVAELAHIGNELPGQPGQSGPQSHHR